MKKNLNSICKIKNYYWAFKKKLPSFWEKIPKLLDAFTDI